MLRFIPTGVGNTPEDYARITPATVHPHGCGEHSGVDISFSAADGSSPRVWGTPVSSCMHRKIRRFIPTGVGNTGFIVYAPENQTVHPHGCGEHLSMRRYEHNDSGSSPRVWGTPGHIPQGYEYCRFIPTGVGNTLSLCAVPMRITVHPHGCGEHAQLRK